MPNSCNLGTLLLSLALAGCSGTTEINSAEPNTTATNPKTEMKEEKKMSQVIEINGAKVAEITEEGEVWIGGTKAGEITKDGEIWVAGTKEGDLTKDGEVWKAGDKVGDITSKGEVWFEGNEIGTVESDGTIWIGSSRAGTFTGGTANHAAVVVFYGFFNFHE